MAESDSLIVFSRGAAMLAEANTIAKLKDVKNLALTASDWARRKGMGEEAVQTARAYAMEAEHKIGKMLKENPPRVGNPNLSNHTTRVLLEEIGLTAAAPLESLTGPT